MISQVSEEQNNTFDKATTSYAHWGKAEVNSFAVKYDANGGEIEGMDAWVSGPVTGTGWYIRDYDPPYREGYVFMGWAESPDALGRSISLVTTTG